MVAFALVVASSSLMTLLFQGEKTTLTSKFLNLNGPPLLTLVSDMILALVMPKQCHLFIKSWFSRQYADEPSLEIKMPLMSVNLRDSGGLASHMRHLTKVTSTLTEFMLCCT